MNTIKKIFNCIFGQTRVERGSVADSAKGIIVKSGVISENDKG